QTDYTDVGKVLYILGQRGLEPLESLYEEDVRLTVRIPAKQAQSLHGELVEATCGRIGWECKKELSFVDKRGT
ncbi:MAG: DUF1949 domain-containing protein, partial [Acetatifactor sp.]|nr:DUF1949 domain-containing protein [Acetatifactor sp.]